jgi:hypothetical protein
MSEPGSAESAKPAGIMIDLSGSPVSGGDIERALTEAPRGDAGRRIVSRLEVNDTVVSDQLVIEHARIGWMDFLRTKFESDVTLRNVVFEKGRIHTATLGGRLWLERCSAGELKLTEVVVRGLTQSPELSVSELILENCIFESPVRLAAVADQLKANGCDFRAGLDLAVRYAEIALDDSRWGAPSVIAFLDQPVGNALESSLRAAGRSDTPEIISLRRANVDDLLLSGMSLRMCRFVKAHNLDRLRLENDVTFARTSALPRTARRRLISEEAHWRAERRPWPWQAFYEARCKPPEWLIDEDRRLETAFDASLVASIYRSLRKGREDAKDEPGAADFYYGEMEMRRHDDTAPLAERAILWLYWFVSGYGLRASRAFAALVAAVLLFAVPLDVWGFDPDRGFGRSLLVSVLSTTSLLRGIDAPLTSAGEWMVTALRLLGPLLFGLMLLSLRGRVKR